MRVLLRIPTQEDVKWIFDLRNDPSAYKNFFNSNQVVWSDHVDWFQKLISQKGLVLYVVYTKNYNVGVVNFTIEETTAKVGINIIKEYRGHGFGSKVIRKASNYFLGKFKKVTKLDAQIKSDNIVSIKAFTNAGYRLRSTKNNITELEFKLDQPNDRNH